MLEYQKALSKQLPFGCKAINLGSRGKIGKACSMAVLPMCGCQTQHLPRDDLLFPFHFGSVQHIGELCKYPGYMFDMVLWLCHREGSRAQTLPSRIASPHHAQSIPFIFNIFPIIIMTSNCFSFFFYIVMALLLDL